MSFKYTDFFDPKDIAISKCWMVVSSFLFKDVKISQMQQDEMKKTFYIGFTECFKIMTDLSEELSEKDACDVLSRLSREASEFHEKTIAEYKKKSV